MRNDGKIGRVWWIEVDIRGMPQGFSGGGLRLEMFCPLSFLQANESQKGDADWAEETKIVGPRTTQLMSTNLASQGKRLAAYIGSTYRVNKEQRWTRSPVRLSEDHAGKYNPKTIDGRT